MISYHTARKPGRLARRSLLSLTALALVAGLAGQAEAIPANGQIDPFAPTTDDDFPHTKLWLTMDLLFPWTGLPEPQTVTLHLEGPTEVLRELDAAPFPAGGIAEDVIDTEIVEMELTGLGLMAWVRRRRAA